MTLDGWRSTSTNQNTRRIGTCLCRAIWKKGLRDYYQQSYPIKYVFSRYSHGIAIGNHRIKKVEDGRVTFSYKNYRKKGKKEELQLEQWEFIRRFAMHIVPHRFVRIRLPCRFIVQGHYGILSNRSKQAARLALGAEAPPVGEPPGGAFNPLLPRHYCSCCGATTTHLLIAVLPPARAGPFVEALEKLCKAVF